MKLIIAIALLFAPNAFAHNVYVKGYTKSNGTYVQPHVRTAPNNTITDNYSYKPQSLSGTGSINMGGYQPKTTSYSND